MANRITRLGASFLIEAYACATAHCLQQADAWGKNKRPLVRWQCASSLLQWDTLGMWWRTYILDPVLSNDWMWYNSCIVGLTSANLSVCMLCMWTSVPCCRPTCQRFLEKRGKLGVGCHHRDESGRPCQTDVVPKGLSDTEQATQPIPHGCLS